MLVARAEGEREKERRVPRARWCSGRGGHPGRSGRGRVEGRVCLTQEGSLALHLITVREWGSVREKAVPRAQNGCLV
jgi:hypothetical protein